MVKKKITKAKLLKQEKRRTKREFKEAWTQARINTLERDNYTCQKCNKDLKKVKPSGRAIHHIIPRQYKELFLAQENLLTLCSHCHHWGKESPHQNALVFSEWFKNKFPERYYYLLKKIEEIKNGI